MTDINLEIARLVQYGVKKGLLHQEDAVFAVNRILAPAEIKRLHPGGCSGGKPGKPSADFKPYHRLGGGKRTSGE